MNQNYPEYIMRKLREWEGLNEDNTTHDELLQEMSPESALAKVLEYEGIIGYHDSILQWIEDIYKIKLNPYAEKQSRQDFVQGLGNIFRAQERMDGVVAMRMDDRDQVTVFFEGGGSHHANCAMDSKRAIIEDILKQAF